MKTITRDEFFQQIDDKKLDLCVSCVGNWPYTSEFRFRNGQLWGKIVTTSAANIYPPINEYLIQ